MRKLYSLLAVSLMAGIGFSANAGEMVPAKDVYQLENVTLVKPVTPETQNGDYNTMPEGVPTQTWLARGDGLGDGVNVQLAFTDDKIYIQGLFSPYMPEGVVIADYNSSTGVASIEPNQLMGTLYSTRYEMDLTIFTKVWEGYTGLYLNTPYTLNVNLEDGKIQFTQAMMFNYLAFYAEELEGMVGYISTLRFEQTTPKVSITLNDLTYNSFTATFTPNDLVSSYYVYCATNSLQDELAEWSFWPGIDSINSLIMSWGIKEIGESTYTWDAEWGVTADTDYEIGVVALDLEGNVLPYISYPFYTPLNPAGVDSIENDDVYKVYNLQGVKVMEGKDLNSLGNGIYVINGKKVVIRK